MKLLFDENISYRLVKKIEHLFPESNHISSFELTSKPDKQIWLFARENNFTIVTNDSDFNDLSLLEGFPPKVIWFKAGNSSTKYISNLLHENAETITSFITDNTNGILIFDK